MLSNVEGNSLLRSAPYQPGTPDNTCEDRLVWNCHNQSLEPGSSVRIVSDYGLDDRAIRVRSPAEARDFSSSHCVQPGSETYPASYPMGTGGLFHGGKARPGRDIDHSPPSNAEVINE
jgi:hypothetical protein